VKTSDKGNHPYDLKKFIEKLLVQNEPPQISRP